jgi:hypothetical protein
MFERTHHVSRCYVDVLALAELLDHAQVPVLGGAHQCRPTRLHVNMNVNVNGMWRGGGLS